MTPGPGAYEDERNFHYKSIAGSKIGRDMRRSDHFLYNSSYKKQEPGRYNLHNFAGNDLMGVPKYSLSKDMRFKDRGAKLPGPGQYENKTKMSDGVPCFSMPGRRKDLRPKVGDGIPGSGAYDPDINSAKKSAPNFSMGKSRRDGELKIFKNTPGAGTYGDKAAILVRAKSASWRIGTEKRPEKQHYVPPTPGPGAYTSSFADMGKNGPKYTANKRPLYIVKEAPGPGAYEPMPHNIQTKSARYTLGTQKRTMLKALNTNPGPGDHEAKSQLGGSKYGFGSSTRAALKPDGSPGPGAYKF